jgi:class 3 adenylate cyclase/tetratricopeptide (TPR) repeat protein
MDARSEIRLVTCLFIDVVGSTDAAIRLGPERMQRLLGQAFTELSGIIAAHGGVVEKYIGDAILALFGVPISRADDAERALRAADACVRWSAASASSGGLSIRAGIETGELLVDLDAVETRQRMVVGEGINLAARLQQYAEPGQIVVGPTGHDATVDAADYGPLGTLELKGLGDVEAWRFVGFRDVHGSFEVEFVGRDAELASLGDAVQRARQGRAILALIVGPPGQGKSRLAGEVMRQSGLTHVLEARCRPGIETGANSPLRQLIESDVAAATQEAVGDRLSNLLGGADGGEVAAALCHSAGIAVDERLLAVSRYEQRELISDAWRRYLEGVARDVPVTVLVEDIHWADPVVLRVIDRVTTDVRAPLLVLATARPEFVGTAHLRPRDNRIQIDLGPLDSPAVQRLVALAGADGAGEPTDVERAGGNPLFVIELARSHSTRANFPVTIQAAIAARLDELPPAERELLQRVSVAGETFDVRDAALLGEREPAEVAAALGSFAHLGFVTPVGRSYRFHHGLVHDVAYGRLPVTERMALHARYALEGIDPSDVEALAHHWWEALRPSDAEWVWEDRDRLGRMRQQAYRIHLAAGARLEERNAYEEALVVYQHALELADATADQAAAEAAVGRAYVRQGLGDDAWAHRLRAIDLYAEIGQSPPAQLYADMLEITAFNWGWFHQLPDDRDVAHLLEDGIRVARATGDDVSLARLLAERAATTGELAGTEEIGRFLESSEAVRFGDAAHRMATVYTWAGRVADGVALYETVFERLIPAGAIINTPEALAWYGLAAFSAGDLARADALANQLLPESLRRSVHTQSHGFSLKAMVQFGRGEWDALRATVQELDTLVDQHPEASFCLLSGFAVGYAAAAEVLAGGPVPADIDAQAKRHVDDSERVQGASVLLPKVMAGDPEALEVGLRGYEPDLRLWDRARAWDVADLLPAMAMTIFELWEDVPRVLVRLDEFANGGARLAEAAAAAIREEQAAANGGPLAIHAELRELGFLGISELLRFRPAPVSATT